MLDPNDLIANFEAWSARLALRQKDLDLEGVRAAHDARRKAQLAYDQSVHAQRELSKEIGPAKQRGEDVAALMARANALKDEIAAAEVALREANQDLERRLLFIPNLPHPDAPVGGEADGVVRRTEGAPLVHGFPARDHVALCEALGLVELGERATRLAGASFVLWKGQGARLERALINFFLELHTREHGYTEVSPPFVVNEQTMTGTGQLPKFRDDMYAASDGLFLIPTAEVPVTNIHRGEILPERELPLAYCAYTPCFRREAGAAGKMTRGLKRLHQFDKVELVRLVHPDAGEAEHQKLLAHCEEPLKRLGLTYRIKDLATGDIGFSATRCFDIEAWAPASQEWLEVSSVSLFTDYQARRAEIRCKGAPAPGQKKARTRLVHTLNGSGLALPRTVVCLLETHQQADGSVLLPAALRPFMGGQERLSAG